MEERRHSDPLSKPISVYEMHLGSWLHASADEKTQLLSGESEPVPVSEWKQKLAF